jgi:hypothetical protein
MFCEASEEICGTCKTPTADVQSLSNHFRENAAFGLLRGSYEINAIPILAPNHE